MIQFFLAHIINNHFGYPLHCISHWCNRVSTLVHYSDWFSSGKKLSSYRMATIPQYHCPGLNKVFSSDTCN